MEKSIENLSPNFSLINDLNENKRLQLTPLEEHVSDIFAQSFHVESVNVMCHLVN